MSVIQKIWRRWRPAGAGKEMVGPKSWRTIADQKPSGRIP